MYHCHSRGLLFVLVPHHLNTPACKWMKMPDSVNKVTQNSLIVCCIREENTRQVYQRKLSHSPTLTHLMTRKIQRAQNVIKQRYIYETVTFNGLNSSIKTDKFAVLHVSVGQALPFLTSSSTHNIRSKRDKRHGTHSAWFYLSVDLGVVRGPAAHWRRESDTQPWILHRVLRKLREQR